MDCLLYIIVSIFISTFEFWNYNNESLNEIISKKIIIFENFRTKFSMFTIESIHIIKFYIFYTKSVWLFIIKENKFSLIIYIKK